MRQDSSGQQLEGREKLAPALRTASDSVFRARSFSAEPGQDGDSAARAGYALVTEQTGVLLTSYRVLVSPRTGRLPARIEVWPLGLAGDATSTHNARVLGVEPTLDLAILQVEGDIETKAATMADRHALRPSDPVHGLLGSSAPGILPVDGRVAALASKECYQESLSATMMRVLLDVPDEALGLPVFNPSGQAIGILTKQPAIAKDSYQSDELDRHILPIELAQNIYEALKTKRSMRSPWTGFSVRALNADETSKFPHGRFLGGVALEYVWPNSPADKLGLEVGDILLRLGYYPTPSVAEFQKWLYMHGVGHSLELYILRGEQVLRKSYEIEERPNWAQPR